MTKPRRFSSSEIQARGECLVVDGVSTVDVRLDAYDASQRQSETCDGSPNGFRGLATGWKRKTIESMSDIPELDRLLEDHHVFKSNVQWERRERFFVILSRALLSFAVVFLAFLMTNSVLSVLVLWPAAKFAERVIPMPQWRNPFVRCRRI